MQSVGPYRLEQQLGQGSFGTVWLGRDERIGRPVAVKVLSPGWAADPDIRRRFLNEARMLGQLEHQHIIPVYDVGETEQGLPYMVMALADRGTLEQRMVQRAAAGPAFGIGEAVAISAAVAEGLACAHALQIVHRDVKPSNVLFRTVAGREVLCLGDFGIARQLAAASGQTIVGGTPNYMAPEQADPQLAGQADTRVDIFAAGAMLYELLTGRVPYPHPSVMQVLAAQLREDFPPLRTLRGDVPPALDAAVARALRTDREQRFSTIEEWRTALFGAAADVPRTPPTVVSRQPPVPPRPPPPMPPPPPPLTRQPRKRGRRWAMVASALVLLLVAGAAAVLVTRGDDAGPGPDLTAAEATRPPEAVVVPGTEASTDTGVDVVAGHRLVVTAAGEVFHNEEESTGPEGIPDRAELLTPLRGAGHAALIGRIGESDAWFSVGPSYDATAHASGRLFLGINDGGLENNSGEFETTIAVGAGEPAPHETAPPVAIEVSGTERFTATGIEVGQGERLIITASGRVFSNEELSSGPQGIADTAEFVTTPLRGVGHGSLIGRIGDAGDLFAVGPFFDGPAPGSGFLYLGINDTDVANNAGTYTTAITLGGDLSSLTDESEWMSVDGDDLFHDSEVDVEVGQRLRIAASGVVLLGDGTRVGPDGKAGERAAEPLRGPWLGSLVAYIGTEGDPRDLFAVGRYFDGTVPRTGRLFLGVNTIGGYSGRFDVTIQAGAANDGWSPLTVVAANEPLADTGIEVVEGMRLRIRSWSARETEPPLLVGRIGDGGEPFPVGAEFDGAAPRSGRLFLGAADDLESGAFATVAVGP